MGRNKDDFSKSLTNNHVAEYDTIRLIEDRLASNMFDLPKIDSSDMTGGNSVTNFKPKIQYSQRNKLPRIIGARRINETFGIDSSSYRKDNNIINAR